MKTTAELVTTIGRLTSKLNEASAKGFVTRDSMQLLYQMESTVDALIALATAEFWGSNKREAR